mgnify:CR=1 FL=1
MAVGGRTLATKTALLSVPKVSKTSKFHLVIHLEFQVKVQIKIKKKIKIKIMILRERVISYTRPTPPPLLKNLFWLPMGKRKQKNTKFPFKATRNPIPFLKRRFRKRCKGLASTRKP